MKTPRDFVIASTVAALFSSAVVLRVGVDIQLWYAVLIVNSVLMIWLGSLRVRAGVVVLSIVLLASGIAGNVQGTDTLALFAKQWCGITASAIYFSCFFALLHDDVHRCFELYVRAAYWFAVSGIVLLPVQTFVWGIPRLQSFATEPAMFSVLTLPAAGYCLHRFVVERTCKRELAVLVAALLLSGSSVGYLGLLAAMLLVFAAWSKKAAIFGLACVGVAGSALYHGSEQFRIRLDDSLRALQENTLEKTNLSTFALFSNGYITARVLDEHPLFGNGLGSHFLSHERFISQAPGIEFFEAMTLKGHRSIADLNAADANSLGLRLLSETGVLGLLLALAVMFRYRVGGSGSAASVSNGILVYFFVKLLRAGHYFSPEQFFFIVGYGLNGVRTAGRFTTAHTQEGVPA